MYFSNHAFPNGKSSSETFIIFEKRKKENCTSTSMKLIEETINSSEWWFHYIKALHFQSTLSISPSKTKYIATESVLLSFLFPFRNHFLKAYLKFNTTFSFYLWFSLHVSEQIDRVQVFNVFFCCILFIMNSLVPENWTHNFNLNWAFVLILTFLLNISF